jgi:hypothetical protein
LVLKFSWKSALNTENDYKLVLFFLANQQLAPGAHQITTNWFFSFLENQHQATDKVYSLVYNFLGQTEWALFKNQVTTDWFINMCCFTLW